MQGYFSIQAPIKLSIVELLMIMLQQHQLRKCILLKHDVHGINIGTKVMQLAYIVTS